LTYQAAVNPEGEARQYLLPRLGRTTVILEAVQNIISVPLLGSYDQLLFLTTVSYLIKINFSMEKANEEI
jgi:hypothetical protein